MDRIRDENYLNLYISIYRQAVKDDCATVSKKATEKLAQKGISKRMAHDYIKANSQLIKDTVKHDVYQEATNYGGQTRKIQAEHIDNLVNYLVDNFRGVNK